VSFGVPEKWVLQLESTFPKPNHSRRNEMRYSYSQVWILVSAIHWVIPFILIVWTWRKNYSNWTSWIMQVVLLASYTTFVFLMGTWMFASFYVRYLVVVFSLAAVIRSFLKIRHLQSPVRLRSWTWIACGAKLLASIILVYFIVGAVRSHFYDEEPVNLSFPFKNGVYAVYEGGNGRASSLMNYHYGSSTHKGASVNRSMKYAVDVTKLSMWGNDANGILPKDNAKYAIFNEVLYSPCDGEIFDVADQWDSHVPFSKKAPYNVGNHIVIKTNNFYVLMGHLQKGSITVKVGDQVKQGQPIAKAGNSGWTLQPHTHIQAMKLSPGSFWAAEGLPINFDGKNTVKNTLFFKPK